MIRYIKYFFYIALNWNIKIAWHIIRREIIGEKKYSINTTGADELKQLEKKGIDITHATIYMPVSYPLLEELFEQLNLSTPKPHPNGDPTGRVLNPTQKIYAEGDVHRGKHFLDIGCGKGRALCMAAHYGFTRLTGIDFSKELCAAAEKNLAITKQKFPSLQYNIINNDAFYFEIPETVDYIFLFNPFDEVILSAVVQNIAKSLHDHPRQLYILYVNPLHKEQFAKAGFKEIYHCKKMQYLEAVILANN